MILQRLAEYYDRLIAQDVEEDGIPRQGFSRQKISFCVVLNPDGTLNAFQSMLEERDGKLLPREMVVPGQNKPSGSGMNPGFLWDRSDYMLGVRPDDPDPGRTRRSFDAFRERHLKLANEIHHPGYTAFCSFLGAWSPERAGDYAQLSPENLRSFGIVRITAERQFLHELIPPPQEHADPSGDPQSSGLCLVTGARGPLARLHQPKIKGVTGAQTAGALLVSFNSEAYESYGKEQSYNAPVSTEAAFKYTTALNHLLGQRDRRVSLGDATVVFWADRRHRLEDFMSDLFADLPRSSNAPEDQERVRQARLFLNQLREGVAESEAFSADRDTNFFLLGLSPNAARVSVRFWVECSVTELSRRLGQHLKDLRLQNTEDAPPLSLRGIVAATGRAEFDPKGRVTGFDTKAVSPQLAGDLARAVLTGGPYPQSLLSTMLRRISSDGAMVHTRIAAIKACLVRNSRIRGYPQEVPVKLDPTLADPAYNLGRLFAALEKIQTDSAGELNSTIKDRYINSAGTTPGAVFPLILKLSQYHLAKLEPGLRIVREQLLGEITAKLNGFPRLLSIEEQGRFWIGYFHQRQDFYTSKKPKEQGATA